MTDSRQFCPHCLAVFRNAFPRCPLDGTPLEPLVGDPLAGVLLAGRYRLEECIGAGGMGLVYRARHHRVSRRFAVKVLYGDVAADPRMRERFAREAEAASRLDHPNVISVIDFGETEADQLFLVMDFAPGPSLGDVIGREGPLEHARALRFAEHMAAGLAHAHEHDLVHRDFKSDNVIVMRRDDGEVARIVDFGLAVILDASDTLDRLTSTGMIMGTPAYMAPEQALGESLDHRTDLFSLGLVMYEMLAGTLPFSGTPVELARQNLTATPPAIAARVPGVSVDPELEALIQALMAKRRDDRPQTAREVLARLAAVGGIGAGAAAAGEAVAVPHGVGSPRGVIIALDGNTEDAPIDEIIADGESGRPAEIAETAQIAEVPDVPDVPEIADVPDVPDVPDVREAQTVAHGGQSGRGLPDASSPRLRAPRMPSRARPLADAPAAPSGTELVMAPRSRPRWLVAGVGAGGVALALALVVLALRGPDADRAASTAPPDPVDASTTSRRADPPHIAPLVDAAPGAARLVNPAPLVDAAPDAAARPVEPADADARTRRRSRSRDTARSRADDPYQAVYQRIHSTLARLKKSGDHPNRKQWKARLLELRLGAAIHDPAYRRKNLPKLLELEQEIANATADR